jgi:hypothetical protein
MGVAELKTKKPQRMLRLGIVACLPTLPAKAAPEQSR